MFNRDRIYDRASDYYDKASSRAICRQRRQFFNVLQLTMCSSYGIYTYNRRQHTFSDNSRVYTHTHTHSVPLTICFFFLVSSSVECEPKRRERYEIVLHTNYTTDHRKPNVECDSPVVIIYSILIQCMHVISTGHIECYRATK